MEVLQKNRHILDCGFQFAKKKSVYSGLYILWMAIHPNKKEFYLQQYTADSYFCLLVKKRIERQVCKFRILLTIASFSSDEKFLCTREVSRNNVACLYLAWICIILALASSVGAGNSIFLSSLPDLNRAGSRMSIRLVAAITLMSS